MSISTGAGSIGIRRRRRGGSHPRSGTVRNLRQVPVFGEVVEEEDKEALEFALFAGNEPGEEEDGKQGEEEPEPPVPGKAANEELQADGDPKNHFGAERPDGAQAAAKHLRVVGVIFEGGGHLEMGPSIAEHPDVVIAPANIGFVGPTAAVKLFHYARDIGNSVETVRGPVIDLGKGGGAVGKRHRIEGLGGIGAFGCRRELAAITSTAAYDGLKEVEQGNGGPRPPAPAIARDFRLRRGGDTEDQGERQGGERQRQQAVKGRGKHQQRERDEDMVFQAAENREQADGLRSVKRLEKRTCERAVIYDGLARDDAEFGRGINAAAPDAATQGAEVFGMLLNQQRFGFAIAVLLAQVRADGRAAIVPDEPGGAETDAQAALLHAPAKVHIVAGLAERGIETAHFVERPFVKRHVATGDVLGFAIGKHDMRRTAGRNHDRGGDAGCVRRKEIVPAHAGEIAIEQVADEMAQPIFIGPAIGIGEGDDFTGGGSDAGIAGDGETQISRMPDAAESRMGECDGGSVVGGTIIQEDDFVIGIIEAFQRIEACAKGAAAFVTGHDDGNPGVALQRKIWRLAKRGLDGVKRILRLTVGGGQTEMPILHALAGVPPVIGETENDRPGKTGAEGGFDLPGEDFAFAVLAFAGGVDAKFAKEERLGISDHLQAREVILKSLALVQVDIEGNEIETVRPEEFRGGKIVKVQRQPGSAYLASATSSSMIAATARAPLQRTMSAGISLATLKANTAGWRSQERTALRTAARASSRRRGESRKQRCLDQGMSTSTRSSCSAARSRSQRGGT